MTCSGRWLQHRDINAVCCMATDVVWYCSITHEYTHHDCHIRSWQLPKLIAWYPWHSDFLPCQVIRVPSYLERQRMLGKSRVSWKVLSIFLMVKENGTSLTSCEDSWYMFSVLKWIQINKNTKEKQQPTVACTIPLALTNKWWWKGMCVRLSSQIKVNVKHCDCRERFLTIS